MVTFSKSGWDVLYTSKRLGHSAWANQASEKPDEIYSLQRAFRKLAPGILVELGTRFGGTTLALHDACPEALLISLDYQNTGVYEDKVRKTWPVDLGDEYADPQYHPLRSWFPNTVTFYGLNFLTNVDWVMGVVEKCTRANPGACTALFVDGFDKPSEVEAYSPRLRVGDILAVNDGLSDPKNVAALECRMPHAMYRRTLWDWSEKNLIHTRFWRKNENS